MADTVTTKIVDTGRNERTVVLTCSSDGTGETNVVKVDKSTLLLGGVEPSSLVVMSVTANIQGFTSVTLKWDNTTDETFVILGSGSFFEQFYGDAGGGGLKNDGNNSPGDIILTSAGAVSGATYTIVLRIRLV